MSNVVTENIDVHGDISHSSTSGCRGELSAMKNITDYSLINLVGTRKLTVSSMEEQLILLVKTFIRNGAFFPLTLLFNHNCVHIHNSTDKCLPAPSWLCHWRRQEFDFIGSLLRVSLRSTLPGFTFVVCNGASLPYHLHLSRQ